MHWARRFSSLCLKTEKVEVPKMFKINNMVFSVYSVLLCMVVNERCTEDHHNHRHHHFEKPLTIIIINIIAIDTCFPEDNQHRWPFAHLEEQILRRQVSTDKETYKQTIQTYKIAQIRAFFLGDVCYGFGLDRRRSGHLLANARAASLPWPSGLVGACTRAAVKHAAALVMVMFKMALVMMMIIDSDDGR